MSAAPGPTDDASATQLEGLAGVVVDVVDHLGATGVGLLVALENVFPPIPSEIVLPVAGYLASQGRMGLVAAVAAATIGSLLGALVLYAAGAVIGRERLRRWIVRLPLLDLSDLDRTEAWFARYGGRAVLLGRCVPVVRSLVSIPAGVDRMPLRTFVPYTLLGSGLWNLLFITAGYQLGARWEDLGRYSGVLDDAVLVVVAVLVVRFVVTRLRRRRLA